MRTVRRSALVPYSAAQMFDLVNDVAAYPDFLHWCQGATIEQASEEEMTVALDVGLRGVHKRFTTRNTLRRPERIDLTLVSGPFRTLTGSWTFEDRGAAGSRVNLALDFDVTSAPLSSVFALLFEEVARAQVAAFITRAEALYA
jgi:ribosome-associated toxin RatA of RatAB toxin-antitoxin module